MKSTAERWDDIRSDPKKLKRVFTLVWVISYGMLIGGFFMMLWIFLTE